MRSSKWLVFIRSRLAGFDRSLTTRHAHASYSVIEEIVEGFVEGF
jgi:hypothetical protein